MQNKRTNSAFIQNGIYIDQLYSTLGQCILFEISKELQNGKFKSTINTNKRQNIFNESKKKWVSENFSMEYLQNSNLLKFLENNDSVFSWKAKALKNTKDFINNCSLSKVLSNLDEKTQIQEQSQNFILTENFDFNFKKYLKKNKIKDEEINNLHEKIYNQDWKFDSKISNLPMDNYKNILKSINSNHTFIFDLNFSDFDNIEKFLIALKYNKNKCLNKRIILISDIMTWGDNTKNKNSKDSDIKVNQEYLKNILLNLKKKISKIELKSNFEKDQNEIQDFKEKSNFTQIESSRSSHNFKKFKTCEVQIIKKKTKKKETSCWRSKVLFDFKNILENHKDTIKEEFNDKNNILGRRAGKYIRRVEYDVSDEKLAEGFPIQRNWEWHTQFEIQPENKVFFQFLKKEKEKKSNEDIENQEEKNLEPSFDKETILENLSSQLIWPKKYEEIIKFKKKFGWNDIVEFNQIISDINEENEEKENSTMSFKDSVTSFIFNKDKDKVKEEEEEEEESEQSEEEIENEEESNSNSNISIIHETQNLEKSKKEYLKFRKKFIEKKCPIKKYKLNRKIFEFEKEKKLNLEKKEKDNNEEDINEEDQENAEVISKNDILFNSIIEKCKNKSNFFDSLNWIRAQDKKILSKMFKKNSFNFTSNNLNTKNILGSNNKNLRRGKGLFKKFVELEIITESLDFNREDINHQIICPGIKYGLGKGYFAKLMKKLWMISDSTLKKNIVLEIEEIEDLKKELPMIHFQDLAVCIKLLTQQPFGNIENTTDYFDKNIINENQIVNSKEEEEIDENSNNQIDFHLNKKRDEIIESLKKNKQNKNNRRGDYIIFFDKERKRRIGHRIEEIFFNFCDINKKIQTKILKSIIKSKKYDSRILIKLQTENSASSDDIKINLDEILERKIPFCFSDQNKNIYKKGVIQNNFRIKRNIFMDSFKSSFCWEKLLIKKKNKEKIIKLNELYLEEEEEIEEEIESENENDESVNHENYLDENDEDIESEEETFDYNPEEEEEEIEEDDSNSQLQTKFKNQLDKISFLWRYKKGFIKNFERVKKEFLLLNKFKQLKINLFGDNLSGKSIIAKKINQMYKIPIINLNSLVQKIFEKVELNKKKKQEKNDLINSLILEIEKEDNLEEEGQDEDKDDIEDNLDFLEPLEKQIYFSILTQKEIKIKNTKIKNIHNLENGIWKSDHSIQNSQKFTNPEKNYLSKNNKKILLEVILL